MKRFWTEVAISADGAGHQVTLDERPVRTPARHPLAVPTRALAEAIAGEWSAVDGEIDPRAMPLTGLANAAIDRVAPDPARFAADLARYGESDLLCYRADSPPSLVARQAAAWDPLLAWARRRFDRDFAVTDGLVHVAQPDATVARLAHAVAALDPFRLAALSPLVTIGGSLVAALALLEGAATPAAAWDAVSLDERYQLDQWGADAEAEAALAAKRRDFLAAAAFLALVGPLDQLAHEA
ncbi:ATP12 family chaperone protein [Sphingomonas sp. ASV193]|uniref:ATP12 family chaperone protein n=1 Tax=Sphingomonas sp. ASV193 TaxID=3144405 RepID=UPI0032E8CB54